MLTPSFIESSKANAVYGGGLGVIMIVSLVLSNFPELALSNYWTIYHKRELAIGLFSAGTLFGGLSLWKHIQRQKMPWKIPQSQISIFYLLFFTLTLSAIIITK